ncbi:MAG: gamma-glutamyl-gamma-aminobutyrate hydrolase family protein [Gammaproteobacteria bacterium]|nr:gamma-glutamyl-gamma-aminobutyrate hydrolase family protein [Gammaproteobacteria bacterium]
MSRRPVIGVPADRRIVDPHPFHMVGEKYINALIDGAAGLPLLVPARGHSLGLQDVLDSVDGLLLTGSPSNVEPHHYGGESSRPGTLHDPQRDETTLPLIEAALEAGVPVFAVCRGFQEMNVVLGGTLHQLVHEVPGYRMHKENPDDPLDAQYGPAHDVTLVEGGLLHRLAGSTVATVNSLHAQGVARLADGVTVEAVAEDGLIEGFTVDGAPGFALAVQWHPEWKVTENPFSMAIFAAFGDACREYATRRRC